MPKGFLSRVRGSSTRRFEAGGRDPLQLYNITRISIPPEVYRCRSEEATEPLQERSRSTATLTRLWRDRHDRQAQRRPYARQPIEERDGLLRVSRPDLSAKPNLEVIRGANWCCLHAERCQEVSQGSMTNSGRRRILESEPPLRRVQSSRASSPVRLAV
jgi:hypothetical protein